MPSPTQHPPRPFLSNFLAAFRARSSFQPTKQPSNTSTTSTTSTTNASTTTQPPSPSSQPSHPRTITPPKSHNHPTTSALSALHSPPLSRSPGTSPGYMSTMANSAAARRRGSESEGEGGGGFREIGSGGGEKWYVGGRTAGGEERFFRLGVVRRDGSLDRVSADRLSL